MSFLGREHTFIVGEVGSNHNQSLATARALIRAAADAGADGAKFQCWTPDLMYPRDTPQYEAIVRHRLPTAWLPTLRDECDRHHIEFLCSVFDEPSARLVDPFVRAHKVASIEASWTPFVQLVLELGKPTMVSDGTMSEDDIDRLRVQSRGYDVTLLHCLTAYPAPLDEMSLSEMPRQAVGFATFGLSDHTMHPTYAPVIATALGASVVEKHVTLNRQDSGPDHAYAIEPAELKQMVEAIRSTEAALVVRPRPRPSEREYMSYRRGPLGLRGQ